jgi:uncharacterized membrane protein
MKSVSNPGLPIFATVFGSIAAVALFAWLGNLEPRITPWILLLVAIPVVVHGAWNLRSEKQSSTPRARQVGFVALGFAMATIAISELLDAPPVLALTAVCLLISAGCVRRAHQHEKASASDLSRRQA